MKRCPLCSQMKPFDAFSVNRRVKDGRDTYCRPCKNRFEAEGRRRRDPSIVEREHFRKCPEGMRRCKTCKGLKSLVEFNKHQFGREGYRSICRDCTTLRVAAQYKARYRGDAEYRQSRLEKGKQNNVVSPRQTLRRALRSAHIRRPCGDSISTAELMQMWRDQGGRCAISGIEMKWAIGKGSPQPESISIDRINSFAYYSKDNVRLVCFCFNNFRGQMDDQEMRIMLDLAWRNQCGYAGVMSGYLSEVA